MNFVKTSMVLSLLLLVCLPYSAYNQSERPSDVRAYCRSAITNQRSISDRRTSLTTTTATVTITNTSSRTIYAPFHAIIEIVNNSGPVTMPDASGGPETQPYNKYYYNLTGSNLADGQLDPGEAVSFSVKFVRKSAVAFRWDVLPYGVLRANQLPVADAGPDQTVQPGATVVLDGSKSSDADGNYLTFHWSFISVPGGMPVPLSNSNTITPSFVASYPGTYVIQLTVNDGIANSAPDTVTITTENSKPVANAGPDQTVFVAQAVTLDSSKSSDVDGDLLTHMWSFISLPPESAATLSDPNAVKPTFFVDRPGIYLAQLIVNDGKVDSAADTVSITTENSKPVANAGPDQTVNVGAVVVLDGSMSTDVDGDLLTYRWSFGLKPAGSSAVLSDAAAVRPSFTADRAGSYVLQLIVNDGTSDSNPASVTTTTRNSAPVANAGADQSVYVAQVVTLDGSMSTDADGDPLLFWWSLTAKPATSAATLSDPALIDPTFIVDRPGSYVAQLIVNDGNVASAPDTVSITTLNSKPVANAGPDQSVSLDTTVFVDGSGSTDADFDALAYRWSFSSKPAGSSAELSGEKTVSASYTPDLVGTYVVQLIVNDSTMDSDPDTVVTEVVPPPNRAPIALDEGYTTAENTLLTVAPGVLANDSDPDGNVLTAILADDVKHGALSLNADGSFTYQSNPSFYGVDSFTYKAYDGALYSTAATVTINVIPIILPPLVTLEAVADQTIPTNITLSLRLLGHSTDTLAALTYSLVSGPAGAAVLSPGVFSFTPTMDQFGVSHAFTVQVQDGEGRNAQRTFHVTVVDQNHPPVLGALTDDVTAVGASYAKTLAATDSDQGDTLSFTLLSGPAGMTLTGNRLAWTPVSEQLGNWPVQVQVTDQAGASDSGRFHVGLPLVKANNDNYQVTLGQVLTVAAPGVLANDFSPAGGGPLTAHQLTAPDKGTLNAFGADGSFSYTAPPSAPAPPVLDAKVKWNAGPASFVSQGLHSLLVGDFNGDGNPDLFLANSANGLMAMKGDGTPLFDFTGLLPAAGLHCYADVFYGEAALGDLDGDGKAEMIVPVHCTEDDSGDAYYVLGASNRVAALSYDPTAPGHFRVKWVSPTTSLQAARPDGSLYSPVAGLTNYVHFTVARLGPGEPPSVLWGRDFPSHGKCADVISGKTDAFCRVVTVHSGIDGSISQRFYYAPPNQTSPGTWGWEQQRLGGFGAPIVADLMGTGQASILFNGTVWDRAGNVRLELDGTGSPSTANDSVVVDLDGDGLPEILTLNNALNSYVHDSALRAYRTDGRLLWQLPVPQASAGRMSGADVDRDGLPEILFFSDNQLWCVDRAGHIKWIHVFGVYGDWNVNSGLITRTPVYDLNGDGLPKVIVQYGNNGLLFLRGDTGQTELSWKIPGDEFGQPYNGAQEPIVADLDGDGHAEIVFLHMASANAPNGVVAIQGDTVPWRAAPKSFNQRAFNGVNINADGSIPLQPLTYWTNAATNVFEQPPPEPYVVDPRLTTQTSFTYAAGLGGQDSSNPATVSIDLIPGNRPPIVTSTPPASVNTAAMSYTAPFTYQIAAYDPDLGDTLSYAVSLRGCGSPIIVTVSPTGLFSYKDYWQPTGLCTYNVDVADNHGGVTQHAFTLFFTGPSENKTVPNLVGQTATAAPGLLAAVDLQVGVVTHVENSAAAGQILSQNPASGTSVLKRSTVDFIVSNGPAVVLPPGPPPQLGNLAKIVVEPSMASRVTGETASFKAIGTNADGTGADITAFVTWSSSQESVATVDAAGTAHASGAGATTVTATANGLAGPATLTVVTRTPGDAIPPTAIITSPADGGTITALAQIVGTASDANFQRYELAVAPAGDTTWTVIGEGTNAVTNGTLGTFDPTILLNDLFTLRLLVFDRNDNETIATSTVQVSGANKAGLFSLTFTDLNIPMAGIPIAVTRTYDSRDKAKGDFGIGWRLGFRTLRLRTNRVPGTGWVRNQSGAIIGLVPTSEHKVSITLPDGKVEEFDLVLSPTSGLGALDMTTAMGYAPRSGTLGRLETLGNPNLLILNAGLEAELVDDTTLNAFEPELYRYTSLDGTEFVVHRSNGVQSIKEANGITITLGANGIIHSAGKSVLFERDSDGRITQIADPLGNAQAYAYDTHGNLIAHTERMGNITRFTYDWNHYLLDIINANGVRASRNEYDNSGRLVATIDQDGNRFEFTHDLNNQTEIQRDPDGSQRIFEYDARGNILTETDDTGSITRRTYDANNNILTETNPSGGTLTYTYSARNYRLSQTDAFGNTITYTRDNAGRLTSDTDPLGNMTTYTYDSRGNLQAITNPLAMVTQYSYDSQGNVLVETDEKGNRTRYEYDVFGNPTKSVDALGGETTFTFDANGNQLTETRTVTTAQGPRVQVSRRSYDKNSNLLSVTDPAGRVTNFSYDALNNQTVTIDANGRRTDINYASPSKVSNIRYADGLSQNVMYGPTGRVQSFTDRSGREKVYEYDAADRPTAMILPDNSRIGAEFNKLGLLSALTMSNGVRTEYSHDVTGRINGIRGATGEILGAYDPAGRESSVTDALGRITRFEYDGLGRQTRTIFPDGTTTLLVYDGVGNIVTSTDQSGNSTYFEYDALGRLTRVIDPLANVTTYHYDEAGNLIELRDANARVTVFEYDALSRRTAVSRPGGQRATFSYDGVGNLIAITDFNGQTTRFEYTVLNQLAAKRFPDGSSVEFTYNPNGTRNRVTDARGVVQYEFDMNNRLLRRVEPDGAAISYTYDSAGNVSTMTSPSGTVRHTRDHLNRLASTTGIAGEVTVFSYDALGNLIRSIRPNGISETRQYDSMNRVRSIENRDANNTLVSSFTYSYDSRGNRTEVIENTGRRVNYAYDDASRLISESIADPAAGNRTIRYTYDPVGNRLTRDDSVEGVTTYSYDSNDRLLSASLNGAVTTYAYDANGNTLTAQDGTINYTSYRWDFENRLVGATRTGIVMANAGYVYDADGLRVSETINAAETRYLVDKNRPFAQVAEEYTASGTSRTPFVYGPDLLSQGTGTQKRYFLSDAHSGVRALTDEHGNITDQDTYDGYGRTLDPTGGLQETKYRYRGEQFDPAIDSYYLRARYYDQTNGRFLSVDPLEGTAQQPMSLHRYLYTNANPVNLIDPSGQSNLTEISTSLFIYGTLVGGVQFGVGKLANYVDKNGISWNGNMFDAAVSTNLLQKNKLKLDFGTQLGIVCYDANGCMGTRSRRVVWGSIMGGFEILNVEMIQKKVSIPGGFSGGQFTMTSPRFMGLESMALVGGSIFTQASLGAKGGRVGLGVQGTAWTSGFGYGIGDGFDWGFDVGAQILSGFTVGWSLSDPRENVKLCKSPKKSPK